MGLAIINPKEFLGCGKIARNAEDGNLNSELEKA